MTTEVLKTNKTKNEVNVLYPHRSKHGVWSFTDLAVGLYEEPFVGEINDMIDMFTNGKEDCIVYISSTEIPNRSGHLIRSRKNETGWYILEETGTEGWLCPAALNYFSDYPKDIYFRIELPK